MDPLISVLIIIVIGFFLLRLIRRNTSRWKVPEEPFPENWRIILNQEVSFYNSLSQEEKKRFEEAPTSVYWLVPKRKPAAL